MPATDQVTPVTRTSVVVEDLRCTCCAGDVLEAVRALPGVRSARLDYQQAELRVDYDPALIDDEAVRGAVRERGYRCEGDPGGTTTGRLAHTAQLAPITCGTKCDRMQYELPHTRAQAEHHDPSEEAAHDGHGGMSHDMSDPTMAAAMERDMRNRFFVALALTIPVFLLSPLAVNTFGLELLDSMDARNWLMLVLSTPVVWYAGWVFIGGAWTSLRSRALNMAVLVATGVLAAWLSSVFLTVIGEETFFEAAAMLVTFVLFGHWMEMKSRKGTSDSLRALFDIVPPTATVIRDGREIEVPTARDRRRRRGPAEARRQGAGRRRRQERLELDRREPRDRGVDPGREGRRRRGDRGLDQPVRDADLRGDQDRRRHRARADHRPRPARPRTRRRPGSGSPTAPPACW